jgi:predicted transcriptional regulator
MKKPKEHKMNARMTIKTGTVEAFFNDVKKIMHSADKGASITPECTLVFENPTEMLHFLSAAKIKLINNIRQHPDSITNIAKAIQRNRSAVCRDIHELEKFGLVKTHEEVNPGHGQHKIVELVAPTLKLEAYI